MGRLTFVCLLLSAFCLPAALSSCSPPESAPSKPAQPWVSLFNGKDLTGWKQNGGTWTVEDGALKMEQGPNNGWGWLWTERDDFRDFELELEWKATPKNTNSGIYFRCDSPDPKDRRDGKHTFQADMGISHHAEGWGGSFNNDDVSGWLEADHRTFIVVNRAAQYALKPYGEWNRYRIVADGPHIVLEMNGHRTVDWTDITPKPHAYPNSIGIQDHGGKGEEGMVVWFRNFRIRELK